MTSLHDHPPAVPPRRVLVVGATGGTGRAVVARLLADGHDVTAFSRRATDLEHRCPGVTAVDGDVTDADDVDRAVAGQDAVVLTLGITENPIRVRLLGPARSPLDVRSRGTGTVVRAMVRHGVRRLVVRCRVRSSPACSAPSPSSSCPASVVSTTALNTFANLASTIPVERWALGAATAAAALLTVLVARS